MLIVPANMPNEKAITKPLITFGSLHILHMIHMKCTAYDTPCSSSSALASANAPSLMMTIARSNSVAVQKACLYIAGVAVLVTTVIDGPDGNDCSGSVNLNQLMISFSFRH